MVIEGLADPERIIESHVYYQARLRHKLCRARAHSLSRVASSAACYETPSACTPHFLVDCNVGHQQRLGVQVSSADQFLSSSSSQASQQPAPGVTPSGSSNAGPGIAPPLSMPPPGSTSQNGLHSLTSDAARPQVLLNPTSLSARRRGVCPVCFLTLHDSADKISKDLETWFLHLCQCNELKCASCQNGMSAEHRADQGNVKAFECFDGL